MLRPAQSSLAPTLLQYLACHAWRTGSNRACTCAKNLGSAVIGQWWETSRQANWKHIKRDPSSRLVILARNLYLAQHPELQRMQFHCRPGCFMSRSQDRWGCRTHAGICFSYFQVIEWSFKQISKDISVQVLWWSSTYISWHSFPSMFFQATFKRVPESA